MFCSTCGNSIAGHLNYCNNCGARTEKTVRSADNSSPTGWVAFSGALLAIFGLIAGVSILRILLNSRLDQTSIVIILVTYFVAVFLMFTAYIVNMSGNGIMKSRRRPELNSSEQPYVSPASFRPVTTAQLESAAEPGSVTEHTTRTLDEVLIERK